MKTSIITTMTELATGKKRKRSFTDINPEATNTELKNFAEHFVGLTKNTYFETERVDKTNVDSEDTRKQFRNMTVTNATRGATAIISMTINVEETVSPAVFYYVNGNVTLLQATAGESVDPRIAKWTVQIPNDGGYMYVGVVGKPSFYSELLLVEVE
ncbi:MAG: hypothetical protein Q4D17_02120 [Planctomycetia bacterium]|nr:hypothetical protein [Planctomycetia bacterium]